MTTDITPISFCRKKPNIEATIQRKYRGDIIAYLKSKDNAKRMSDAVNRAAISIYLIDPLKNFFSSLKNRFSKLF